MVVAAFTALAAKAFGKIGLEVKGIHEYENASEAVEKAEGIFTGGGNTFLLVKQLYAHELIKPLQNAIFEGTPYLGTSAGTLYYTIDKGAN